eukprot:CAMPEP_0179236656 /NCGR_PEP_ID=MMETSP0797-20121207/14039_1 /TAXON_ID=47934 /ORGANISM="Dinophysis acuminata, Strain DAEP01" /LENGTH=442 /DNA_ID=CAMNT_0020943917 /DNA_START=55 /DNA_END=1384 /DNA_ORIENTATION=+
MAEAANLLAKYSSADGAGGSDVRHSVLDYKPDWGKFEATRGEARNMKLLEIGGSVLKTKAYIQDNMTMLKSCMELLKTEADPNPTKWILTLFHDMLREDSSCFSLFESALQNQIPITVPLNVVLGRDTQAHVRPGQGGLAALRDHRADAKYFSEQDVTSLLSMVLAPSSPCSELGVLDTLTNLLKSHAFRRLVWKHEGAPECIFKVEAKAASPPVLYKCAFALWMISFDPELTPMLRGHQVTKKVKDILTTTRVEKVVRVCLTLLKNLMGCKDITEEIVEEGMLEVVQQLEYEKWRDAELYHDITEMQGLIATEVSQMSNFDRYERELQTGNLSWGFIHSTKFWAENVLKFEQNDFRALRSLADVLADRRTSPTTLAVACHDVGEFVSMHPLGKKTIARYGVKERIMELMGNQDASFREVRREALLCCQKIMLNKWQDLDAP